MTNSRQTDKGMAVVTAAQAGDAAALDALVHQIQDRVHRLAMRMLADRTAAQDATQEILILVVTKLSTFRGESAFDTWVYRVATNYLLTARKVIARDPRLSFDAFEMDLAEGLVDDDAAPAEDQVMLNELRLACTMAMLLCLDRAHRIAYVFGDILEFDHAVASDILDITPAAYRQRLTRARAKVVEFTGRACGLANPNARCSCPRRLPAAIAAGRMTPNPGALIADVPSYEAVRDMAARSRAQEVVTGLQRATGALASPQDLAAEVMRIVEPQGR